MSLHPALKELLVCPQDRAELEERNDGLFCASCGLLYPIRDGIPVMLVEEATQLDNAKSSGESS